MGLISSLNNAMAGLVSKPRTMDIPGRAVDKPEARPVTRPSSNGTEADARGAAQAREAWVNRTFDASLQSYHSRQVAAAAAAEVQVHTLTRLQALFGAEGAGAALDRHYEGLLGALQLLAAGSGNPEAQAQVGAEAQGTVQVLHLLSANIGDMRQQADARMARGAEALNGLLKTLSAVNHRLQDGEASPVLLAQRDRLVASVAERIDIKAEYGQAGDVALTVRSGPVLLGAGVSRLDFENTGQLLLTTSSGKTLDLSLPGVLVGGELGGLLALRDGTLGDAQSQLDEIAAGLALAFSMVERPGVALPAGGFTLDISGMRAGDDLLLAYGQDGRETRIRVINSVQPLDHMDGSGQRVLGIDLTREPVEAAAALAEKLPGLDIVATEGAHLRIAGTGDIAVFLAVARTTSTGEGDAGLPLFVDSDGQAFIDNPDATPLQKAGFAGRIAVDSAALAGGAGQANSVIAHLGGQQFGSGALSGTVSAIIAQTIAYQGNAAAMGLRQADDRQMMLDTVNLQMSKPGGASVNGEMTRLLDLETMFAANLRVVMIFQDLMSTL